MPSPNSGFSDSCTPSILGKRQRVEGETPKDMASTQGTIDQFFIKLSKKEGLEQAQHRLISAAEQREDWLEEEELRCRQVKLRHREANNHSQKKLRNRKCQQEIADGVRSKDGKIKKVCILYHEKK